MRASVYYGLTAQKHFVNEDSTGIASKILHFDHEAFEKIYQLLLYVRRIKQQMNGSTKYLIDPPQEHGSWSGRYSLFIRNSGRILSNL